MPVYDQDNKLRGVLGVDKKLAELSDFLANLTIGRRGMALIFDKQGKLVAYPKMDRVPKKVGGKLQPVMLDELADKVFERAYNRFIIEGPGNRSLNVDRRRYLNTVSSLKPTVGRNWSIMIIVPEEDFVGFVRGNFRTILIMTAVIVILASLLAGLLVFQGLRADRLHYRIVRHRIGNRRTCSAAPRHYENRAGCDFDMRFLDGGFILLSVHK
jgi:hypothetical protein